MIDQDLDRLLDGSAPPIERAEAVRAARVAHLAQRDGRRVPRRGRRAGAVVLVVGAALGVGATAAAVDGDSLANYLDWRADNAIDHHTSDGNVCHMAFRAIPETGLVDGPKTPPDDPSVRAAQAYLRTLDLDSLEVKPSDVAALRRDYEQGAYQGPGDDLPSYTDAFFENHALFVAMVDAVTEELARQGLVVDGRVTFESDNDCTKRIFRR